MHRLGIIFRQAVGAVHYALKINAVLNPEHVSGLMGKHFATATQDDFGSIGRILSAEARIISNEAVNADPVFEHGFAENKIPCWIGIEVLKGDAEEAVRITRQSLLQQAQNVASEELSFPC